MISNVIIIIDNNCQPGNEANNRTGNVPTNLYNNNVNNIILS